MNTRKLRKVLLTLCSALLLVSLSVGMTVAYLTSTTEVVENTFTVGQVKITLDEAKVNADGKPVKVTTTGEGEDAVTTETEVDNLSEATRVQANSYKLMPGHTYTKDPTIHIDPTSEEAYLRVKVEVTNTAKVDALFQKHNKAEEGIIAILTGLDLSKWDVASNTVSGDVRTYVLNYKEKVSGTNPANNDVVLFTAVDIPDDFDNEDIIELNNTKLTIVAEAIQSAGFETAADPVAAAWTAFEAQGN